jgi:hypothetical protein
MLPAPIGARGDRAALLAQDAAGRLDRVTVAAHVVDERDDQQLRSGILPVTVHTCASGHSVAGLVG